jgi:signal transduction histidine kinase/CheY-like chemotaxis protein
MPTGPAGSPSGDDLQLPGGFVLVRRLRGDSTAGCGAVEDAAGRRFFARWAGRAPATEIVADAGNDEPSAPENEHRALTVLSSSGVPAAVDLVRTERLCASISTWIDGASMAEVGRLDDVELERVAEQMVSILARAHWCGWVHGDIKPANVIVGSDRSIHLIDWAGARKIGERAPPGTLGYAPPWAWSESHKAQPRDDYYALATTLWELRNGARAQSGARSEVLHQQTAMDFAGQAEAPPTVAQVFACAASGADLASSDAARAATRGVGVRVEAIEARLIRRAVVGAARRIGASDAPRAVPTIEATLPIDARDLPCASLALAAELRNEHGRNALAWPELLARLRPAPTESSQDGTISRVDRLRDRSAHVEFEARRVLSTLHHPVLVVGEGDVAALDAPAWSQLRGATSAAGDGRDVKWTLVLLDAAAPAPTDRSREVLEELLGGAALADRLTVVASSRWSGSIRECLEDVLSLATSGRLIWADGLVDVDESGAPIERASRAAERRDPALDLDWCDADADRWTRAIEAWLDAGELAALEGKLSETIRACVRVHTYIAASPSATPEHALRLADLWSECGRGDAAQEVLQRVASHAHQCDKGLRLARIHGARGDSWGLATALDSLDATTCSRAQSADVARLKALALILKRDFHGAHAQVRAALVDRADLPVRCQLWLLTTLGNVLRMRGRHYSACRVLRLVKRNASRVGSARLQVAAATNLIIALAGKVGPRQLASEAWAVAERSFMWGMRSEGLVNSLTAATYWVIAGDGFEAMRVTDHVLRMDASRQTPMSSVVAALLELRLAAFDIEGDWSSIESTIEELVARGSIATAHIDLLREELCIRSLQSNLACKAQRRSTRDRRCIDTLRRVVMRQRPNEHRLRAILRLLVVVVNSWLPVTGHASRMAVRNARNMQSVTALLRVSREIAADDEAAARLSVALHAAALAWSDTVDRETAAWFASNAPGDERRRPAGLRLWEWRLAVRRAAIESGGAEHDDQDVESVLSEMESMASRLWPDARGSYVRSLPLGNVARLSGCEVSEEELRTDSDDAAAPFDRLRAFLFRRRVREERGGKRAAGLERVLRGALRLQSATDIDGLLDEIVAGVAAVCRAERAVVVYGGGRRPVQAKVVTNGAVSSIPQSEAEVSLTAVARVRETKRACLIDDACGDEGLGDRPSVMQYRPRSLIVAPLQTLGEFLGYIYVENRSVAKSFSGSDVELVEGFAAQAAFALENAQLVDELRRSCEELDRARSDAVRAESLRVVGRMASEVAHDFNNLLTAILGETQLLMQADGMQRQAESLAVIERAALDGADVVRRMQATTRVKDPSAFVVLSPKDIVRNVLDMMRWRATSDHVEVHCDVDAGLRVRGVPSELREVLTNLVVNALDAMPGGGELRIIAARSGGDAVIDVEDTGHGMDARTAAQAFDPFFSTKGEKGNGLGLSIAYGIMQRHGGDIQVASHVGRGTRMRLTLPLAQQTTEPQAEEPPDDASVDALPKSARALIVDDEPAVARVLSTMLRRSGVDVSVSIGGLAGLASIRASDAAYDLVITDVNMPDVNGIEVAMAALKTAQPARVVLMSGSLGGREEATAQALGVQVLRKPFTVKDIDRLVLGTS